MSEVKTRLGAAMPAAETEIKSVSGSAKKKGAGKGKKNKQAKE